MSRLISVLVLVFMLPAYAMSDMSQWAKAIPDASLVSVERTLDGGYIAAGSKDYKDGSSKALLVRVDSSGNILWAKAYQISNSDSASMVWQADDGGFVFIGTTSDTHGADAFLVKIDASGNILWQRVYGTPSNLEEGRVILRTLDGGFFLLGNQRYPKGGRGIWCMKLNSTKEIAWVRIYGRPGTTVSDAAGTSDGGLVLVGAGEGGLIVVKLNASGNITWQKKVAGFLASPGGITTTADDGYVVGYNIHFWGVRGGIVKLDSSGKLSWSKFFPGQIGGVVTALRQENDGHILVMGRTGEGEGRTQIWSARFDPKGGLFSKQAFGRTETRVEYRVSAIHGTPDDGTVFVGSRSRTGYPGMDSIVGRTSWAGDICAAFQKSANIQISLNPPTMQSVHIGIKKGTFDVRKPNFAQTPVATKTIDLCQ